MSRQPTRIRTRGGYAAAPSCATVMRGMRKDWRPLIKSAVDAGWTLDTSGRRHPKLVSPAGAAVVIPSTSSDRRALKNATAQLRRAGCPV